MIAARDETRPAYRLVVALGIAGAVILVVGLAQFFHYEPPGQRTGARATILGVFDYDARTGTLQGPNRDHFKTSEPFAARVDWSSLPGDTVVGARWFSGGFAMDAGGIGPATARSLAESDRVVPVNLGDGRLPAGHYQFVVERYAKNRPVEVLARVAVLVVGS